MESRAPPEQLTGRIARTLLLAASYYVAGRLALLMAIPPGYATAVWPAAGLALAGVLVFGYRAWPGVVLGSFLINLPTALDTSTAMSTLESVAIAAGLGLGAALEATGGAWLVRRFAGYPVVIADERQIIALLVLGGPVACLASATVGIGVLVGTHVIPSSIAPFSWFTWWVGDSIGVLVVMPLYLAFAAFPSQLPARKKMLMALPVAVMLALVELLFVQASALEQRRIEAEFARRTDQSAQALQRQFAGYAEMLEAVASFHAAVRDIDRLAFHRFSTRLLRFHPGLQALSWNPRVADADRPDFEAAMQRDGVTGFRIRERDAEGRLAMASRRTEYFPIALIEPVPGNEAAFGFDVASDPRRRGALAQARLQRKPVASDPVTLVQEGAVQPTAEPGGMVVFLPIFGPVDEGVGRPPLRGYAAVALRIRTMMASFLRDIPMQGMRLRLYDVTTGTPVPLYDYHAADEAPLQRTEVERLRIGAASDRTREIRLAGRRWLLSFSLRPDYLAGHRSRLAWTLLAGGLLFTALFAAFLLILVARGVAIENAVAMRTRELRRANTKLQSEIVSHARTEDALRSSQEQTRSIIDTAQEAYVAIDTDSRIVEWNHEAERIFGFPREDAVGKLLTETILPPQHRAAHVRGIARYLATGEGPVLHQRIELTALRRDGSEFPVELTIWPTSNGGTQRFNAFLHDISERQRAIRRLMAQQAAAAALVESDTLADAAPKVLEATCDALAWDVGVLWTIDHSDQTLRCAEFWRRPGAGVAAFEARTRALGFGRGIGLPGHVWQDGRPQWIADVAHTGYFLRSDVAAIDGLRTGFAFPIRTSTEILGVMEFYSRQAEAPDAGLLEMMDTLGTLLGQFMARRRAEKALAERMDIMREQEQRLAEAQQVAHLGSWEWDVASDRIVWSDELFRIYGLQPHAFEATYERFLQSIHPDDRERIAAAVADARRTRAPFVFEHRVVRPDGTERVVQGRGRTLCDESGDVVRMRGTAQDITERKQTDAALAARAEELARSNEELEQFAYVASHDLQEPLRMVSSYTQLLARRYQGKLGADADDFIGYAVQGAQRMQGLIQALLAYSRASGESTRLVAVDMEALLARTLANLHKAIEESDATITHDPLPVVVADELQLGQVLQNLLSNALKFRAVAPPMIHVSVEAHPREWRVAVRDNGIGVEPEYAERVFVIFKRLHHESQYPRGTGIGLTICKKIVQRHGGRIWVEPAPGGGSTFCFTLPRATAKEPS